MRECARRTVLFAALLERLPWMIPGHVKRNSDQWRREEVAGLEDYPSIFATRAAIQRTPRQPLAFYGQELLSSFEREEQKKSEQVRDAELLRPVGLIGADWDRCLC